MSRVLKLLFLFILLISQVYAAPPEFVYRGDKRSPDIIFKEGFRPRGENKDLIGHVTGETSSCAASSGQEATTNFVSTSEERETAWKFAINAMQPGDSRWVYTIRATENFYSAPRSVAYIYNTVQAQDVPPDIQALLDVEHEYSALGGINVSQIQYAIEYTADHMGQINVGAPITNPAYEPIETHASEGVYPGTSNDETGKYTGSPVKKITGTNHSTGFGSEEEGCSTWTTNSVLSMGTNPQEEL